MQMFAPKPPAPTKLGRYRQLSTRAGVFVSPLALGGVGIGNNSWEAFGFGRTDKETSFKLLDAYFDAGGNFIDTASNYQDGSSEEYIGEWAEKRGIRDQLVIATKFTLNAHRGNDSISHQVNYVGNSSKNLRLTVEGSLKRLRSDYIDILYLHVWDLHTSVEEIMDALHHLVAAGKVLYLGVSDAPAWFVTKANAYASAHGKTPFVVYQASYSILNRDAERDIIPMCKHEGMAVALWGVLGGGSLRTEAEEERRKAAGEVGRTSYGAQTEEHKRVSKALDEVAKQVGAESIAAVATAYTMTKAPYVFPIVGPRKVEQLGGNIAALDVHLTAEQIKYLDGIVPFDPGYPHIFFGNYGREGYAPFIDNFGPIDAQPFKQPIVIGE